MPSQYTQGTDQAKPHMPAALPQYEPKSTDNRPMGTTLGDKKRAAIKNDFASMGNALGKAVQGYEQQKQDKLKDQILAVMKAKQQVANANSVLQNPNADQVSKDKANNVLALNTKKINDLMTEKNAKQMAKAFDISYSDPDKNKTPEVAAGLAAHKEFQAAGPHTADNPQEAAVAKLAQGGQAQPGEHVDVQNPKSAQQSTANTITPSYGGQLAPGMLSAGNIDLSKRPNINNNDGSHSSVFSMSSEIDGKEVMYPGVGDGITYPARKLTEAEALNQYKRTGKSLGIFKDSASADAYGEKLHEDQERGGATQQYSRAAAVLAKDMPSIEANPQYAAALKQKEDAQKQYMTLAPAVINNKAKASLAAYTAGNAATRLQYKAITDMQRAGFEATQRAQNITAEAKAAMARVLAERTSQQMAIMTHAEAAAGVSSNPNLNAMVKQKLGNDELGRIDTYMDGIQREQLALEVENNTQGTSAEQIAKNNIQYQFNIGRLNQIAAQRANIQAQFFPDVTGQSAADRAAEAAGKAASAAPAKGKNGNTQQQSGAANDQRSNPSAADLAEAQRQAAATQPTDDGSLADQFGN
jgi:hypothetical protein